MHSIHSEHVKWIGRRPATDAPSAATFLPTDQNPNALLRIPAGASSEEEGKRALFRSYSAISPHLAGKTVIRASWFVIRFANPDQTRDSNQI